MYVHCCEKRRSYPCQLLFLLTSISHLYSQRADFFVCLRSHQVVHCQHASWLEYDAHTCSHEFLLFTFTLSVASGGSGEDIVVSRERVWRATRIHGRGECVLEVADFPSCMNDFARHRHQDLHCRFSFSRDSRLSHSCYELRNRKARNWMKWSPCSSAAYSKHLACRSQSRKCKTLLQKLKRHGWPKSVETRFVSDDETEPEAELRLRIRVRQR